MVSFKGLTGEHITADAHMHTLTYSEREEVERMEAKCAWEQRREKKDRRLDRTDGGSLGTSKPSGKNVDSLIRPPLRLGQTMRLKLQQQYASVYPSTIRTRPKTPDHSSSFSSSSSLAPLRPRHLIQQVFYVFLFLCLDLLPQGRSFGDSWLTGSVTRRSAASGIRPQPPPPPSSARPWTHAEQTQTWSLAADQRQPQLRVWLDCFICPFKSNFI